MFEESTIVFSGVVETSVQLPQDRLLGFKSGKTEITFRVGLIWKGPLYKSFSVVTGGPMDSCRCRFEVGKHYFVYAQIQEFFGDEILYTDQCMRIQLAENAVWDRAVLREPYVIDATKVLGRPTEAALEEYAEQGIPRVSWQAKKALEDIRKRKSESSGGE